MKERVGVFGGTFDPPHLGHLIVAQQALELLDLNRIVFVPASAPPHKSNRDLSPSPVREEMIRRAIRGNRAFECSPIELNRPGPSYTVETLEALSERGDGVELVLLVGIDQALEFGEWRGPERILELARVAVLRRPEYRWEMVPSPWRERMEFLEVAAIGISSSLIRDRCQQGLSVRYLVPDEVQALIEAEGLYREEHPRTVP